MSTFSDATSILAATLRRHAGQRATYTRGSHAVTLVVIPGRTSVDVGNDEGAITNMTSDDWDITASQLVLNGERTEPRKGDRITLASGTVYVVVDLAGEPCWRYTDQSRVEMRVHTRSL